MKKNKKTRSIQNDYEMYGQFKMWNFSQADKVKTNNARARGCLASAVQPWRPAG